MPDGTYKRTENVIAKHPGQQMLLWGLGGERRR